MGSAAESDETAAGAKRVDEAAVNIAELSARLLRGDTGSGKAILLATHYHVGAALISRLTGDEAAKEIILRTAPITQLRQQPDGRFRIVSLNEAPFKGVY